MSENAVETAKEFDKEIIMKEWDSIFRALGQKHNNKREWKIV